MLQIRSTPPPKATNRAPKTDSLTSGVKLLLLIIELVNLKMSKIGTVLLLLRRTLLLDRKTPKHVKERKVVKGPCELVCK